MKTPTLICLSLSFCAVFSSCKKDEEEIKPANIICDGKSGNYSYLPLSVGNQWIYKTSKGSFDTLTIVGYEKIGLYTCFKAYHSSSATFPRYRYFRYENEGDVKESFNYTSWDCYFIKFHCQMHQELGWGGTIHWTYTDKRIASLSSQLNTSICNYSNCVKISNYDSSIGVPVTVGEVYFKKGIGIVYEKVYNNGDPIEYTLVSAIIK